MTRTAGRSFNRSVSSSAADGSAVWAWVTRVALVLAVAVAVARLLTPDVVRDAAAVAPGSAPAGRDPAAGTGIALDLVAAVPALLVLARRAFDRDYRLAVRRSHWLLLALVVWMAASADWASDRYAAVVSAATFASAASLLWAASQLVRSWAAFRVVTGVALGLLLALAAHTAMYKFVDAADTQRYWAEHKQEFLNARGWAADSFLARQYEQKLTSGEQVAFYHSANTLASVGVLLLFAAGAIGVQRAMDDRDGRWLLLTAIAVAAGGWVLMVARSKTSLATPVLGVGVLSAWWLLRGTLRRRPGVAYAVGVGVVVVAVLGVVGLGLARGGLFPGHFSNSLDFRWKYWTAAAGVVRDHPIVGVGWDNFGRHYLAHRVPDAAEEIKDPHDFLVRFAAELGVVGLALVVAWLLRTAWELTRPRVIDLPASAMHVGVVAWVVVVGMGLQLAASMDPSGGPVDVILRAMRPLLLGLTVLFGGLAAAMRSPQQTVVDDRPAPLAFAAVVVGLGLFLLHNTIDFGWFEAGPMTAFMLLIGAALGVAPAPASRPWSRGWAIGGLAVAVVAWATVAVAVGVPIASAAVTTSAADDVVRTAAPEQARAAWRRASAGYAEAAAAVPYDGEAWARAARAAATGGDLPRARSLAATAAAVDPRLVEAWLLSADLALAAGDRPAARAAFDAAVALVPRDVPTRLHYADALDRMGDRSAAAAQYRAALSADAALPAGEPRRLSPDRVADVRRRAEGG